MEEQPIELDLNVNIWTDDGETYNATVDGAPCCYYMPLDKCMEYVKERIEERKENERGYQKYLESERVKHGVKS